MISRVVNQQQSWLLIELSPLRLGSIFSRKHSETMQRNLRTRWGTFGDGEGPGVECNYNEAIVELG